MNFAEFKEAKKDPKFLSSKRVDEIKKKGTKGTDKHVVHQGADLGDDGKPLTKKEKDAT